MNKFGIDQGALIDQFSQATEKQGEAVRTAVHEATLKALQGRELTLKHIKDVLGTVSKAASAGAGKNPAGAQQVEALLGKAVAGMDAALVKAVEANRRALQQLVDQGVNLRDTQGKKALANIEKMEDAMFATIRKSVAQATQAVQGPWEQALGAFKMKGTATGAGASEAVEQLTARAQSVAREGRALGNRATQALIDHYAALASGVLIGMSTGLQPSGSVSSASSGSDSPASSEGSAPARKKPARKRASTA